LRNPALRAMAERNLADALAGKDSIGGATDNSSNQPGNNLAYRDAASGRFIEHRVLHGEHFFSPGPNSPHSGPTSRAAWARWYEGAHRAPAAGAPTALDLLAHAQRSGLIPGKIAGEANVSIDLNGFPRGTKTSASASGVFKQVQLNRGTAMPRANADQ
jgi:hypothetical protein